MKWKIVECYWERGDTRSMGEIAATFTLLNLIMVRATIDFHMPIDDRGMMWGNSFGRPDRWGKDKTCSMYGTTRIPKSSHHMK